MNIELVKKFKDALAMELKEADRVPAELSSFPFGSCEETSKMLALYLSDNDISDVVYTRNNTISEMSGSGVHYWVVVDGTWVIDLTAHQFDECDDDFIVSQSSDFHSNYELESAHIADINDLDGFGSNDISKFYKKLTIRLKNT
ncbi:hypothetical protein GCM10007906_19680 [Vibrio hyugaensis]|uniref:Uncharacterized protein n=1 Tax=Vibrio hyugaensis TaxID=1534743 RepID=A0ABQ5Y5L1_9VIBR|nr:hypothetical protein [Vibrio hyugaensis]GLR04380.1 hypothetical protein GCM10007906_19680 [Vibrio hyugaensis]